MKKNEPWTITEKPSEVNRNWVKSLFERKNKETLKEDIKNKPRRDMKRIQKCLITAALYLNPFMTAGEFAQFHNKAMREIA